VKLLDLLTSPVLGAPRMVYWLANEASQEAERELLDEGRVRAELLELQTRYDLGEVNEEEFAEQETALLERLNGIREAKAKRYQQ
jgi:hypothetical protein